MFLYCVLHKLTSQPSKTELNCPLLYVGQGATENNKRTDSVITEETQLCRGNLTVTYFELRLLLTYRVAQELYKLIS